MAGKHGNNLISEASDSKKKSFEEFDQINWALTSLMISAHSLAAYSLMRVLTGQTSFKTILFHIALVQLVNLGCVAGVHRLWSHRTYKAKLPLRLFFMIFSTISAQGPIYLWARWHRQHHKFSDTAGDPHNPRRGFFYAQIGWFLLYDHQKFLRNSKDSIATEDLERDEVVMWQHRNYYWFVVIAITIPSLLPWVMEWEHMFNAIAFTSLSILYLMHLAGLINSFAHSSWGSKPYDKYMEPSRINLISPFLSGEGDHNYHHTFPWDYKSAEEGTIWNIAKLAIDFFCWVGLAYDLKSASSNVIARRAERTGDGSLFKAY